MEESSKKVGGDALMEAQMISKSCTAEGDQVPAPGASQKKSNSEPPHSIVIKWAGKEIPIEDIRGLKTVLDLKVVIKQKTGVEPDRQKLLNLNFKGKQALDDCPLANLNLKVGHKVMMMGSLEKDIENVDIPPEEQEDIHNDLNTPEDEDDTVESNEIHLNKIARRVIEYDIKIVNPSRPGKKLLVLDIDYTLFDHLSTAETGTELMRPFLHEFLTSAYTDYDIVIWSASNMKWIEAKMKLLGVDSHPEYKIAFYLDYLAMITVNLQKKGVKKVKPLGVIWGKFPQYTPKNTVMIDDVKRNFIMNPQSGLCIRPFRSAHVNRATDRELVHIGKYLRKIARLDDFSDLNHRKWQKYKRKGSKKRRRHTSPPHGSSSGGGTL